VSKNGNEIIVSSEDCETNKDFKSIQEIPNNQILEINDSCEMNYLKLTKKM
jgi:hypothetical protein